MERQRLPRPPAEHFSLDFFSVQEVYGGEDAELPGAPNPDFSSVALISFTNFETNQEMVAVIRSGSAKFTDWLKMVADAKVQHPDVTDDSLRAVLKRFAESYLRLNSRPVAEISYDSKGSYIYCETPNCRFHQVGGCLNPKPVIFDDCPDDQWCMTYEPQDERGTAS